MDYGSQRPDVRLREERLGPKIGSLSTSFEILPCAKRGVDQWPNLGRLSTVCGHPVEC